VHCVVRRPKSNAGRSDRETKVPRTARSGGRASGAMDAPAGCRGGRDMRPTDLADEPAAQGTWSRVRGTGCKMPSRMPRTGPRSSRAVRVRRDATPLASRTGQGTAPVDRPVGGPAERARRATRDGGISDGRVTVRHDEYPRRGDPARCGWWCGGRRGGVVDGRVLGDVDPARRPRPRRSVGGDERVEADERSRRSSALAEVHAGAARLSPETVLR